MKKIKVVLAMAVLSLLIAANSMAQEKATEQYMLGAKYFDEEKNYEQAAYWFGKAADQGVADAASMLKQLLVLGYK